MNRDVFTREHDEYRQLVRSVFAKEVVPHFAEWERAGMPPRELYARLGELGFIGVSMPAEYGGGGEDSYLFSAVLTEESIRAGTGLGALRVHMDIVAPYITSYADERQRERWMPGIISGRLMTAIAMTEPGAGSDLAGIRTTAAVDGDDFVVNGSKTFITGGANADLFVVVARTSTAESDRRAGLSLIVLERGTPGFTVGDTLAKLGMKVQDTVELSMVDVRVPRENLLGDEGLAFEYLAANLPQERLSIAVGSVAAARAALELTVSHARERSMFGKNLGDFQNTRFVLADVSTQVEAAQAYVDRALQAHEKRELSPADAARLKLFCTEMQGRVVDACLQLFGGYGYMLDYPISRLYADARVTRIYGGTSEVMKSIVARSLGL